MASPRRTLAWLVHLYTASGGLVGMFALMAVSRGDIQLAFLLLGLACFIDATDGLLARLVRVSEVLPGFSGAQVDNAIDVFTFIWIPIFIMGVEDLLPHPFWMGVPIIASLYAYGQVNMKSPDNFFLGFPSYWNIVALYMWWLRPGPVAAVLMVVVPGILSFIPTRYLYPSRNFILWKTTWGLALLWMAMIIYLLLIEQPPDKRLVGLSLFFPFYYLILSFFMDWSIRRGARLRRRQAGQA